VRRDAETPGWHPRALTTSPRVAGVSAGFVATSPPARIAWRSSEDGL